MKNGRYLVRHAYLNQWHPVSPKTFGQQTHSTPLVPILASILVSIVMSVTALMAIALVALTALDVLTVPLFSRLNVCHELLLFAELGGSPRLVFVVFLFRLSFVIFFPAFAFFATPAALSRTSCTSSRGLTA